MGRLAVHLPTAREGTAVSLLRRVLSARRRPLLHPVVPNLYKATPPLHLLLCTGFTANALAVPGDAVWAAFIQVQ